MLNQADRLTPDGLAACRADLQRLLQADGLDAGEVLVTSARDGSGVVDLQHRISVVVAGRAAAVHRLEGDLRSVAGQLRAEVADAEPRLDERVDAGLVDALSRAAGLPVVLAAVERDYRREAWSRTGWPFTRWVRALQPDPLRRLRLRTDRGGGSGGRGGGGRGGDRAGQDAITAADVRAVLGRSSLPPATPAARSSVELATRDLGDRAGAALPQRWADSVAAAATPPGDDLGDALDRAVMRTPLRARNPRWWAAVNAVQWLLALSAVLGLAWLAALAVMAWLRLPALDTPRVGILPAAHPDAARRAGAGHRALGGRPAAGAGGRPATAGRGRPPAARERVGGGPGADHRPGAGRAGPAPHHPRSPRRRCRGRPAALSVPARAHPGGLRTCPPRGDERGGVHSPHVLVPPSTGARRGLVTGGSPYRLWSHPPLTAGPENR